MACLALGLCLALVLRVNDWPISWPRYLAYLSAIGLFLVGAAFAFWAYCCARMRYVLAGDELIIGWGWVQHRIPIRRIARLVSGRGENRIDMRGISWWGHHVGRARVAGIGEALFFSTHRSPEDVLYVQTRSLVYAISPQDPARFAAALQRLRGVAGGAAGEASAVRNWLAGHPLWGDRTAALLIAAAIALNVALFGSLFAVYPGLHTQVSLEFPPLGDETVIGDKKELLKLPGTALALLALNLSVALALHRLERPLTYLLLGASIFLQVAFWIGTAIAIKNA